MAASQNITDSPQLKTCTKCNEEKPLSHFHRHKACAGGFDTQCKSCKRTYYRQWQRRNHKERPKAYRGDGVKECLKCNEVKALAEFHNDKSRPDGKFAYCKSCKIDQGKEPSRKWKKQNKERVREKNRKERRRNPEKFRQRLREYRAKKKGRATDGKVPTLKGLLIVQGGLCANCKRKYVPDGIPFEVDHIIPLARGGMHTKENVQALCRPCNRQKGAKMPQEWAAQNGRLI